MTTSPPLGAVDVGEVITGGAASDVIVADNGAIARAARNSADPEDPTAVLRAVTVYDVGHPGVGGGDTVEGGHATTTCGAATAATASRAAAASRIEGMTVPEDPVAGFGLGERENEVCCRCSCGRAGAPLGRGVDGIEAVAAERSSEW